MASKRAKVIGIGCLGMLVLGIGFIYITSGVWGPVLDGSNDLDAALAKAKASGLPMSAHELNPNPPVPEAENAAPTVLELEAELEKDPHGKSGDLKSPKGLALMARVMPLISKLAQFQRMDMRHDWDLGPAMQVRGGPQLRYVAKVHQFHAIQAAMKGDRELAIKHIRDADKLVTLLYDSPMLIDSLIAKAIHGINCTTVTEVAAIWNRDPEGIRLLHAAMTPPKLTPFSRTLDGEFFTGLVITRNHVSPQDLERMNFGEAKVLNPKTVKREGLPTSPLHRANLAVYANTVADLKRIGERENDPLAIGQEVQRITTTGPTTLANAMTRILLPVVGATDSFARSAVLTEMRDSVLKLHEFRQKSGAFPATLAEAGIVITDPFAGKSVIYKSKPDEFVIYSVGSDGIDSGGPGNRGDHGFRFPSR